MAKKKTYADEAKAIMNRYKIRLGDKFDKGDNLALEAMNQELSALQEKQETARVAEFEKQQSKMYAKGGRLPMYYAGGTMDDPFKAVKANPKYAYQLSKIAYAEPYFQTQGQVPIGSDQAIDFNQMYITDANQYLNIVSDLLNSGQPLTPEQQELIDNAPDMGAGRYDYTPNLIPSMSRRTRGVDAFTGATAPAYNEPTMLPGVTVTGTPAPAARVPATTGVRRQPSVPNEIASPIIGNQAAGNFGSRVIQGEQVGLPTRDTLPATRAQAMDAVLASGTPYTPPTTVGQGLPEGGQTYNSRVPWMGAAATALGSVLANRQIDFGDQSITPQTITPRTVDYSREREQFQRDRDIAQSMIRRSAAQGGSRSGLMERILTGATGTQRNLGRQFSQSLQTEQNQNAQILNQAAMFNAQQKSIADRLNTQMDRENLMINEEQRRAMIEGLMGSVVGYGQDLMSADQYDQMLAMMTPDNYQAVAGTDSPLRRFFQVSPTMRMKYRSTGDVLTR